MEPTNPNSPENDPPAAAPDAQPASRKATQLRRDSEPDDPALTDPVAAEPPTPAEPAAPAVSAEELARRQAAVEATRNPVINLFTGARPKPAAVSAPLEAYSQAIRETETAATAEWEQLRGVLAEALGKLQTNEQPSLVGADAERQRQATAYRAFFDGLVPLEQSLTGEVERLQETDAFQQAPQPLKDALLNYKKGIEIIHRMVKRLQDRKKPMDTAAASVPDAPALPEAAPDLEQWPAVLTAHCTAVHDWRTARSDAARNAQKAADAAKRETLAAVKNLLGALDGIESGQRSEPELLSRLSDHHADHGALIDAWFGTYDRIEELLKPFFAATGLEPMVIEPGTIFAPDTMEPGGTVADPSRKNEEVATMLRRGFKFAGENIRPALVEVVVNTNSG